MTPDYFGPPHHMALLLCEMMGVDPVSVARVSLDLPIQDDPPIVVFECILTPEQFRRAMRPPVDETEDQT